MFQVFVFTLLFVIYQGHARECVSKNFGNGGTVCVCNSTYCDTLPKIKLISQPKLLVYTSNQKGLRFDQTISEFKSSTTAKPDIFIDSERKYQTILGFGGAFTDATGYNIKSLPVPLQEVLLESYFSQEGLDYNFGRVPMGGTDFSFRNYTYDDGPADPDLKNFHLEEEDFKYKMPYIKKALKLTNNNLHLIATPWISPSWMKKNSGGCAIREDMYQPWTEYYVRFLDEYQKAGIGFWGITTGNEPIIAPVSPNGALGAVCWQPGDMGKWIQYNLGPYIRQSRYSEIKIMTLDDQINFLPSYVEKALNSTTARKYIDGIAVHWYADPLFPHDLLTQTHKIFPEKFILSTEASVLPQGNEKAVLLGSWERGERYSSDIIQDISHWVTGWIDWNMVLDTQGGPTLVSNYVDAPIIVDATKNEFYKQPMFYHLGHFSKFVPRGSIRIHAEVQRDDMQVVAFRRPDNGTVVVILNKSEEKAKIVIGDRSRGSAELYVTERSINTVLYW